MVKSKVQFSSIKVIIRETNIGLAPSTISGVNRVLELPDYISVLEYNLWAAPTYLDHINQGLERYRDISKVGSEHGYCYQFDNPAEETFFLRGADCLSWASWEDRWQSLTLDSRHLLKKVNDKGLPDLFNF